MMLILIFIIGFLILRCMGRTLTWAELIGFALPAGLLAITLPMLIMDCAELKLNQFNLSILTLSLLVVGLAANYDIFTKIGRKPDFEPLRSAFDIKNWGWMNIVWVLMLLAVVYIEYVNFAKCLCYPTYDRDSMAAFDTFGYVCAREGTYLRMSLFEADYIPSLHHAGSAMGYMPMAQLSYAYMYVFGAETSKAVPAFMYLSFLIGFYGLCRRRLTHTASMMVLLGVVMTPEMTSFASHSVTNVMHACIASAAMVYLCLWTDGHERKDFAMACLLLTVNVWIRAEGIVFVAVAWIIFFISMLNSNFISADGANGKENNMKFYPGDIQKFWIILTLTPILPFVLWIVCTLFFRISSEGTMILQLFWDGDKLRIICEGIYNLLSDGTFYGWTFNFALLMLHLFIFHRIYLYIRSRRTNEIMPRATLTRCLFRAILLGVIGYIVLLYQIDYQWDSIHNVLAYSAKRFLFCFVPIAWYFSLSVEPMQLAAKWLERRCGLGWLTEQQ